MHVCEQHPLLLIGLLVLMLYMNFDAVLTFPSLPSNNTKRNKDLNQSTQSKLWQDVEKNRDER